MGLFDRIRSALGLNNRVTEPESELDRKPGPELEFEPETEPTGSNRPEPTGDPSKSEPPKPTLADVERDPELEAQDDAASFDFERDIARFFTAEFRLEQAWNNLERRELLFSEYAIRDGVHWYQVKATFRRWLASPVGKAKYPDEAAIMQARMTTTQTVTVDELEQMIEDARRAKDG